MSSLCPCNSGKNDMECCHPIISGLAKAETAETLMRARYTAHAQGDIDFIIQSHHPATRGEIDRDTTKRWAEESQWLGLEIRDVEEGGKNDGSGAVEFVAKYRDAQGKRHEHYEMALFEKLEGDWYFRDAEVPQVRQFKRDQPKQGRNEACACGSGKKFKKCCGANN